MRYRTQAELRLGNKTWTVDFGIAGAWWSYEMFDKLQDY